MKRGSRVWWMYYGIQTAIWAGLSGAFLVARVLVKDAWEVDINEMSGLFIIPFFLIIRRVENIAEAVCRKAGLWQEAPRGARVERHLRRSKPDSKPHLSLTPLDLAKHSRRSDWIAVCVAALMGIGGVALTIDGLLERKLDYVVTGILSAVMMLGIAVVGSWSIRDSEVRVDEHGLHLKRKRRVIPWSAIQSGKVAKGLAADGTLHFEEIFLKDAKGKHLWRTSTRRLPPQVRADLFAWIQARTGLREPNLHEEMYAWLESISGTFALETRGAAR